ncbi:MAG: hypothetical protein NTW86_29150, partial [Candidatus Sumerlaeota bacterium]|nr:hypothetical protein [Candidatus Sumerlaeota bacterium]
MTFAQIPDHPALAGIAPDDLKFWRGDHLATAGEPERAERDGGRAIVVSGSREGIAYSPLLEFDSGKGVLILSQFLISAKLETEPTAARLLQNCLNYLAWRRAPEGQTAVAAASPDFLKFLHDKGVVFDDLSGKLARADLAPYQLLVVQGDAEPLLAARAGAEALLARGGTVYLHRPTPESFAKISPLHGSDLTAQSYAGPLLFGASDDPMQRAFTREDLYWLGQHAGSTWSDTPLATGMADFAFVPSLDEKAATPYDARKMITEGAIVGVNDEGAFLSTNGAIVARIETPKAGTYVLGLVARGTPAGGGYPVAAVSVGEGVDPKQGARKLGVVSLTSDRWETYPVLADLAAGPHSVSISFTNDARGDGEDRNFYLKELLVAPAAKGGASFLTQPPALVRLPRGKGAFVVDAIRWDTEKDNDRKADRLACSLLAAAGAEFENSPCYTVEAEDMTPDPKMPHFSHPTNATVALNSNGYIQTELEIARAGSYQVDIIAQGTQAKGVFPIVEVLLDGKSLGKVELTGRRWRAYPLGATLPAGRHQLRLAFINDIRVSPKEDRN